MEIIGTTTMLTGGRVTLPAAVMERLGLRPGDKVKVLMEDGKALIQAQADPNTDRSPVSASSTEVREPKG